MTKYLRNFTLLLLLACTTAVASAQNYLGIDGEESTSIGIYIKDIRSGKVLVDHNSQMALTPASILKCVTTATALQILGPDYRFTTSVSMRGSATKGVLNGDLIISGAADPTLESSQFTHNLGF
ncbi:MAG: D-alanyl-D-alanine carboxypeptidase, partial [Muribaculaceae bacterium]|nr:D-alanyl-D-alanine carboxypeptidase [Muribaculaceae bacterium]